MSLNIPVNNRALANIDTCPTELELFTSYLVVVVFIENRRLLKYLLKSVSYLFIIKTCLRPHPAAALSCGGSHEQVSPVTPQDPRLDLDL